jgi:SAM-dependent methyltransferase
MANPACRLCGAPLRTTFVDLGMSPPCEHFLDSSEIGEGEMFYPLHVRVCDSCLLVQLPAYIPAEEIFVDDYAYFSSYSDSWVAHAKTFVDTAIERLPLSDSSFVVEVASNDGYLLQHVVARGIRALGVEPAANVAAAAEEKGVATIVEFLGEKSGSVIAAKHGPADLVVGNNVFAHVPDIVDFAKGLRALVAEKGRVSLEFPHLLTLIRGRAYDTIYHEHYSYLTLLTASRVLATADLTVVDVEQLSSHGGSLRVWSAPSDKAPQPARSVATLLAEENSAGLHTVRGHSGFSSAVAQVRDDLVRFLIDASRRGKSVAAYGAPGKGNTLLNHAGVRADLLSYAVDRNPFKHGRFLPGTHIPVQPVEHLARTRPDYIVILPWNLRREITKQLEYVREWGAQLVVPLPSLEVF